MPLPLLIPLAVGAIAANYMGGKAAGQRQALLFNRKEELASEKAFMKVLDDLAQGKRGEHDVRAVSGLETQIKSLPGGAELYDAVLAGAKAGNLHQQSMQGIVQALFGSGAGQGNVPSVTGGGNPGSPPLMGAPAPTAPAQDLPAVSARIAEINQTPTLSRTPAQLSQRGALIDEETNLTDKLLKAGPNQGEDFYDYAAAKKAGVVPRPDPTDLDENGQPRLHWDSRFKFDNHPNRFIPSELGVFDSKNSRLVSEHDFARIATPAQKETFAAHAPLPAAEVQGYLNNAAERPEFPALPNLLKMKGVTTITIPKDMFGFEIHGSKAEALSGVIGAARQRGFSSGEIYNHLKSQGIDPPEQLSSQAFNEFAGKYLTDESFLKNPRKALQEIATNFPSTDPKALTHFGQQAFTSAYIGAKQRLRATGQFVSDRSIAQAAFNEAVGAVGSEFVPDSVLQDLDRTKASTTDNLMVEVLDKALAGDKGAMAQYGILLQMNAGKIAAEEAARRIASIKAEQGAAFMSAEQLKDLEKNGQPLPFGTTQAQAAGGAQIIPPEKQAARTQRSMETDKMQFVAQRALPVVQGAQARAIDLMDKVQASGFVGKVGALSGLPSKLGQELAGYDDYRVKFIGNLRSLAGETAGVITDKDIDRFASLFPEGKSFVTLLADRGEQLIKNFSEMEAVLSDRLGQEVHPFADIIAKLKARGQSHTTFEKTLDDFDKAMKGSKK